MNDNIRCPNFAGLFCTTPHAEAIISGGSAYPDISGRVRFYQIAYGVIVVAELLGLPVSDQKCKQPIFAFHIHEGNSCTGNSEDEFADSKSHYNPGACPHPYHAGDMPPLFGADGMAFSAFLTDRFTVKEVIGHTVILHSAPDDFTTQPSGNAGKKIACGVIMPV